MSMRYLGTTGLEVSDLCLGAMMFGKWGNRDHADCGRIVNEAIDAGINFIDTADIYAAGESEEIVGGAIKGRRDEVVLATKFFNAMGEGPNRRGGSRRWIMQAVEESLRRLGTDYIDLYQMHRPDDRTDIDETLSALTDLVRQGKVRYLGSSTFPAEQVVQAQWVAKERNRERFVCEQPPYSIFVRSIERSLLPTCQAYGMGVIVWSPLNGGWLTGKYVRGEAAPPESRGAWSTFLDASDERKHDAVDRLKGVAAEAGLSLTHLALAWTLEHPGVTSAIIGPRTYEQFTDLLAARKVRLSTDVLDAIDEIVPPGVDINPTDAGLTIPALGRQARRRPR